MSIPAQEKMITAIDYILYRGESGVGSRELSEYLMCTQRTARRIMTQIISMKWEFKRFIVLHTDRDIKILLK